MGAPAGSLLASSAIAGGSLTGWGCALALLPSAALPRRWGELLGFGSTSHRGKLVPEAVSRRLRDVSHGFSTVSRGDQFHWLPWQAAEASDLQPLHSRPAEYQTVILSASHLQTVCKALHALPDRGIAQQWSWSSVLA
jgi:hypothetical protein